MKKFLLSCFLAAGIGANAQFTANVNFESGDFSATNTQGFTWFGIGGLNSTAANSCSVANSWITQFQNSATNLSGGFAIDLSVYQGGQTNNGKKIDVSVQYKKQLNFTGTMTLAYFEKADSTPNNYATFTAIGTPVTLTAAAITNCTTLSGTIPAGALDPTKQYGIGVYITRPATYTGTLNLFLDDLTILQENPLSPSCTTFTSPTSGATVGAGSSILSWNAAAGATAYKLTLGTTSGGSDLYNGTVTGTSQAVAFPASSNLYAKVIPTNANGDATGCSEISFSTNSTVSYCAASATNTNYNFGNISGVTFSNIAHTSPTTDPANNVGYKDFTSTVGNVSQGVLYPISIAHSMFNAGNGNVTAVWIDYNQDGFLADSERVILTTATGTSTGNITIPVSAKLGNTRMRVRLNLLSATPPACGATTYGQTEDYTINIAGPTMAVSDVNKAGISLYPNPFTDVLKISDVKGVKSVSVNDVSGREVKSLTPSAELNLSNLKAGLYIVNLKMEDGSVKSFKAIKK